MKGFHWIACLWLNCLASPVWSQQQVVIETEYLPGSDTVMVYTPTADSSGTQKRPVLYLLHGWSGSFRQWGEITDLQDYADQFGFVIICPDGFFESWYVNSPRLENLQFESFFLRELHPHVVTKFSVDTSRVFISGLSMGGHGALYLYAKNPELFRSAASSSGVLDLRSRAGKLGMKKVFGQKNTKDPSWENYSVIDQVKRIAQAGKPIYFDCGQEDFFLRDNRRFKQACDKGGIEATYSETPGGHNRSYWKRAIKSHFEFFSKLK